MNAIDSLSDLDEWRESFAEIDDDLEARVRDLEVEVFGYASDEDSAGQEAYVGVKQAIVFLDNHFEDGVPVEDVYCVAGVLGVERDPAEQAYQKLKRYGEVYERRQGEVKPI